MSEFFEFENKKNNSISENQKNMNFLKNWHPPYLQLFDYQVTMSAPPGSSETDSGFFSNG